MDSVCLGALACLLVIGLSHVQAQEGPGETGPTTTTIADEPVLPSTSTTETTQRTTTTLRAATTTTQANGGRPVPPPAAGPTQTLVPDLLGTPLQLETTTTFTSFPPLTPSTLVTDTARASTIATDSDSPSGMTLLLAAVAWLASFGGVLVYAEERRASRWKHLAR